MMLAPHLHLARLIETGEPNPDYIASLIGVVNVATVLAYMDKDRHAIRLYESVVGSFAEIHLHGLREPEQIARVCRVFCIAEQHIVRRSKHEVLQAIRLVESHIVAQPG